MEDILSQLVDGCCVKGRCQMPFNCIRWRERLGADFKLSASNRQKNEVNLTETPPQVERHGLDESSGGIETCGTCQRIKCEHKRKRAEDSYRDIQQPQLKESRRHDRSGQDVSFRFLCRSFEANADLEERNDKLRHRRVETIPTSLTESSDGTMTGASRKRRFSNLGLNWELLPNDPLAKRIRDEKTRESLERDRARVRHERPSWFGTPEDPLPDFWMGRPVLPESEIKILKDLDSIPKYYVSQSEENMIRSTQGDREQRLSIVIRRLEAELMSRDFWMQSLGFEAADDLGNFPSGDYRLVDMQGSSAQEDGATRVERWVSNLPRF
ncbi:hypothetical protein KCV03_g8675, partial [Aureobasidium melanogenum]